MPDLDALASWLQDRYIKDVRHVQGWVDFEAKYGSSHAYPGDPCKPTRVLADLASKRALLADLMAEPHDSYCGSTCTSAHVCDRSCSCDRDARVLRRLRILAAPYVGRDDTPAELREETRG